MNFAILAIGGKATAGKSELAKGIIKHLENNDTGYKYKYLPLADKLKDIARDLFGWDGDKNMYMKSEEKFFTDGRYLTINEPINDQGRMLLINIGTMGRAIRKTVWIDYVSKKIINDIQSGEANNKIYIIDDLRYKDEVEVLKKFGNKVLRVKVQREGIQLIETESEIDLDDFYDWHVEVDNNGTKEDIHQKAESIINRLILCSKEKVHS